VLTGNRRLDGASDGNRHRAAANGLLRNSARPDPVLLNVRYVRETGHVESAIERVYREQGDRIWRYCSRQVTGKWRATR
jgi:hypothetical protein